MRGAKLAPSTLHFCRRTARRKCQETPGQRLPSHADDPQGQVPFHVGPFLHPDAVHHGVTDRPIAPRLMMPDHAVLSCTERGDGLLGCKVEVVGAKADDLAAQLLKCVGQQKQLASS